MALFESYERREKQILAVLKEYGINSIEEAGEITKAAGLDVYAQVEGIQPICFENAKWAYTVGAAIAIKKGCKRAADAAAAIGEGLQAFCIPGSVADQRKVGLGHGNLGKMLLEEETECFAFLAGHESFAAAEGAIGIAEKANKVRQKPLRVILNGLGKDAAQIISRSRSIACKASFFEIPIRLPPSVCFIRSGPHSPDPFLYLHRLPLRPHGCFPAPWRWWPHARWNPDRCSLILPLTYFFQ